MNIPETRGGANRIYPFADVPTILKAALSINTGESYFEALSQMTKTINEVMLPELRINRQKREN